MIDGRAHLPIGEQGLRASSNPPLKIAQAFYASAHIVNALCALGNQACDHLVVAGNHDLLALGDAIEQFAEPGFGFKCGDGRRRRPPLID